MTQLFSEDKKPSDLPLVAIITPTYNGGKYLDRALQSVQAQTYPNIVHIVLNNASTDNTTEILSNYTNTRIPVRIYSNEALLKREANWNKAFSYLPEDAVYAKLLCADDVIRPECIERFVEVAQSDPDVSIVLSDDIFDDHIRAANLPGDQAIFNGKMVARRILECSISWLPYHHFFIRIPQQLRGDNFLGEDWSQDVNMVMASAMCGNFGYIHSPLVYTRYHADSVTGKEVHGKGISIELMQLTLINRYSEQLYGNAKSNPARDRYVNRMCRFILLWLAKSNNERASKLRAALLEQGIRLSVWDYLRAILSWPPYALLKRTWQRTENTPVDESSFMRALPAVVRRAA